MVTPSDPKVPPATPIDPAQLTITPESATAVEVIQQQVTTMDYLVLRYAVIGLVLSIVLSLLVSGLLIWQDKEVPDGIIAMGGAAIGALATMLVRPPLVRER